MTHAETDRPWRLAVDVGGTFIDFALENDLTGEVVTEKQPSRPETLVDEFMAGMARLPVGIGEIGMIVHGTTHGLNALVEERGAQVGLLTTAGFGDVLLIGRASRPQMYDPHYAPQPALIRRSFIREVTERVDARGGIVSPLDLDEVEAQADALVADGATAIAVSFLHSYRFPDHEHRAAERVRIRHPGVPVTCSSDLTREWREYERTSTAVANAYIQTGFADYVDRLRERLREAGYDREVVFVQSNGGTTPASVAAAQPVRTLNSGPAGGIMGASRLARLLGIDNVIASDVGGTTCDVGVILGGRVQERSTMTVNDRPIQAPSIDIVSIGAGGGSIARIDAITGALRMGPESAGATPGPACFGRGGQRPTVTDCQVQLGRLDPHRFLQSRMPLDAEAATRAITAEIAEPAGLSPDQAADGALEVTEANMANAIRQITTERGLDPTEFTLISYGGGGGLFVAFVSENLGIRRVVLPPHAAVFSAWGMLSAGYREDRTVIQAVELQPETAAALRADFDTLTGEAEQQLVAYGLDLSAVRVERRLDVKYPNQAHALQISADGTWPDDAAFVRDMAARFAAAHEQRYGHSDPDSDIEVVATRIAVTAERDLPPVHASDPGDATASTRSVHFRSTGRIDVPVVDRRAISGAGMVGPAVVEDTATTIIVPPTWRVLAHDSGALLLEREETAA